jgi:8-oxo-dGTP diphosphatase
MKLATLCYVKHEGQTLMLHRVKKQNDIHEGKWNGLGGKFDPGETPEECVAREVLEESGLIISDPILKGFLTFPAFDGDEDWYVFVYIATEFSGDLIVSPEGNLEWIDDADVLNLPLWEGDQIFLEWMTKHRYFSGKFTYAADGRLLESHGTFH